MSAARVSSRLWGEKETPRLRGLSMSVRQSEAIGSSLLKTYKINIQRTQNYTRFFKVY
jgi:hypothetical protein